MLREAYPSSWRWLRIARRIGGWLTDAEGNALFELARQRTPERDAVVVELGSWQGRSSVLLAAGLAGKQNPRLICVDPFGEDENRRYQAEFYQPAISAMRLSLECVFQRNIRRCGLNHMVKPIKGYSFEAVRVWQEPIDILFIDASHDYESVHRDLLLWAPFVKVGGLVALHDVSPNWPGPSRVMAEDLQPPYFGDLGQADSLLWAVKKCREPLPECPQPLLTTIPKSDFDARQRELSSLSADRQYLLKEVELRNSAFDAEVARLSAEFRRARESLSIIEEALQLAMAELREARHANSSLRASWSWRMTAPLRVALDTVALLRCASAGLFHWGRLRGIVQWFFFRRAVMESGIFDEHYYLKSYPDVARMKTSPLFHFFVFGSTECRQPHFLFDTHYYLAQNSDVAASHVNPLLHYLKWGAYEGRSPHPDFDSAFYLQQYPDVRELRLNPLAHYLGPGIAEGRDPNCWFDTSAYLDENPHIAVLALNPLIHYLTVRRNARNQLSPLQHSRTD